MKCNYLILSILCAGAVLSSCSKKLDKLPQGEISEGTFWTTEKEARLALNACYNFVNGTAYDAWYNDGFADNCYCQYPWESNATEISAGNINAASIDQGYDYTIITRCNYFLANVDKVTMDETLKKRYIGEARALRAYRYFLMTQYFGPLPLIKDAVKDPASLNIAPVSQEEIYDFVTSELDEASAALPDDYSGSGAGNEKGRITKWAALSLEARAWLYRGQWSKAALVAKQVIDSNRFKLFRLTSLTPDDLKDDYTAMFSFADDAAKQKFYKGLRSYEQQFWTANEYNPEVVLDAGFILNDATYSNGLQLLLPPAYLGGWSSIEPTQELVDAYWKADGTTFTPPAAATRAANFNKGNPVAAYYDEFKNRDTRLYASVLFPGNPWNRMGVTGYWDQNETKTGYTFRKLVDPGYVVDWTAPQNFQIIRYAEVLLMFAEAQNEAEGPGAEVYSALNDIRDRAGMPPVTPGLSKDELRKVIQNERRIELAQEGFRYDDMRRWNLTGNMKNEYSISNGLVQERKWQDKFKLLPYPQTAVDRNGLLKPAQSAKGY